MSTQPAGSCSTRMIRRGFSHAPTSRSFLPDSTGKKLDRSLMSSLSKEWFGTAGTGCFTTAERTSTWGSQQHPCTECSAFTRRVPLHSQSAAAPAIECAHFRIVSASGGVLGWIPICFCSLMMGLQFLVVLFVYPETKGVSLEEMQQRLGIA